ncbi:unnamed protein product [Amoebophrya sp. A25]|nr:unnamed protein product [Amoebophrya sp. A25]|eukprot:GSA25T00025509001.1
MSKAKGPEQGPPLQRFDFSPSKRLFRSLEMRRLEFGPPAVTASARPHYSNKQAATGSTDLSTRSVVKYVDPVGNSRSGWLDNSGTLFKNWGSRGVVTSRNADHLLSKSNANIPGTSAAPGVCSPVSVVVPRPTTAHSPDINYVVTNAIKNATRSPALAAPRSSRNHNRSRSRSPSAHHQLNRIPLRNSKSSSPVGVRTKNVDVQLPLGTNDNADVLLAASTPLITTIKSTSTTCATQSVPINHGTTICAGQQDLALCHPASHDPARPLMTATRTSAPISSSSRNNNNFRSRLSIEEQNRRYGEERHVILSEKYRILQEHSVKMRARIGDCERTIAQLKKNLVDAQRQNSAQSEELRTWEDRALRERHYLESQIEGRAKENSLLLNESVNLRDACDRELIQYKRQLDVAHARIDKLEAEVAQSRNAQKETRKMDSLYAYGLEAEKQHLESTCQRIQEEKAALEQEALERKGEVLDIRMQNATLTLRVRELERKLGFATSAAQVAHEKATEELRDAYRKEITTLQNHIQRQQKEIRRSSGQFLGAGGPEPHAGSSASQQEEVDDADERIKRVVEKVERSVAQKRPQEPVLEMTSKTTTSNTSTAFLARHQNTKSTEEPSCSTSTTEEEEQLLVHPPTRSELAARRLSELDRNLLSLSESARGAGHDSTLFGLSTPPTLPYNYTSIGGGGSAIKMGHEEVSAAQEQGGAAFHSSTFRVPEQHEPPPLSSEQLDMEETSPTKKVLKPSFSQILELTTEKSLQAESEGGGVPVPRHPDMDSSQLLIEL